MYKCKKTQRVFNRGVVLKGYHYDLENEKILAYMKLSTEEKLKWLDEINHLTNMVLSEKEKEFRNKLRAAQL